MRLAVPSFLLLPPRLRRLHAALQALPLPRRAASLRRSPTEFAIAFASGQKILRGLYQLMGNTLGSWACPLCNSPLILSEYPSKRGFRLTCKGTDSIPHRLRIYLEGFRKDASFLPVPKVETVAEAPRNSRVKDLLARASRLAEVT